MKGWTEFAGGLNTSEDSTGEYSIFANYEKFKIMFHVTTLLPDDKFDEQRIAKKKHTGNDLVVIIFSESAQVEFSPKVFTSQFNHVFIVVVVDHLENDKTFYRVNVVTKPGVKPIPPFLPDPPVFEEGPQFTQFMLTKRKHSFFQKKFPILSKIFFWKVINGERAAMYAPDFTRKVARTRRALLGEVAKSLNEKMIESKERKRKEPMEGTEAQDIPQLEGSTLFESGGFGISSDVNLKRKTSGVGVQGQLERVAWLEGLNEREWKLLEVLSEVLNFGKNAVVGKSSDEKQYWYKVQSGKVVVKVGKRTIREIKRSMFQTCLSTLAKSESTLFLSSENNTSVMRFEVKRLAEFFLREPMIGRKFYQNVCLMLARMLRKLTCNFVRRVAHEESEPKELKKSLLESSDLFTSHSNLREERVNSSFSKSFSLPSSETLLLSFPCSLKRILKVGGTCFLSSNFLCFGGFALGKEVKQVLRVSDIRSVKGEKESSTILVSSTKQKMHLLNVSDVSSKSNLILELASKASKQEKKSSGVEEEASKEMEADPLELTLQDISQISTGATTKQFRKGEKVISAGKHVGEMFYVSKGSCCATKEENESCIEIANIPAQSFFGEISWLEGIAPTTDVIAKEDSEITLLHREKLVVLFKRSSFLALKFFKYLSELLTKRYSDTLSGFFNDPEKK